MPYAFTWAPKTPGRKSLVPIINESMVLRPRSYSTALRSRSGNSLNAEIHGNEFIYKRSFAEVELAIADEPTSALDVTTQKVVIRMIFDLLEKGIFNTMIFITHELPLLRHVANNIAIMYAGEFVEKGTNEQVVFDPRHPYTKALMGSMLSAEPGQKSRKPVSIEGAPPSLAKVPEGCRFAARCPVARADCKTQKQELRMVAGRLVRCNYAE